MPKQTIEAVRPNPLRTDPTRTATQRQDFERAINRRLRKLQRAITQLVVGEDAFGLQGGSFEVNHNPGGKGHDQKKHGRKGAGVKKGGAWDRDRAIKDKNSAAFGGRAPKSGEVDKVHHQTSVMAAKKILGSGEVKTPKGVDPALGEAYADTNDGGDMVYTGLSQEASEFAAVSEGAHLELNLSREVDRMVVQSDVEGGIAMVHGAVPIERITVVKIGTKREDAGAAMAALDRAGFSFFPDQKKWIHLRNRRRSKEPINNALTVNTRWQFLTDSEKLEEFKAWIKAQVSQNVLAAAGAVTDPDHWLRRHIANTYRKGMSRAFDALKRPELARRLDFFKGRRDEFLRQSFARPVSVDRVKLLVARTFNDLEGVANAMATQMQRTLGDGFIRGDSPFDIARQLNKDVADIGKKRARMIARTEVVRAHNEGQLDAMKDLGVTQVGVAVEWRTSGLGITARGNASPCSLCAPLNGIVMDVDTAHGMLPRHPNCMCSFLPANVGESTKGQKRTKHGLRDAINKSIMAERPKKSKRKLAQQKRRSRWVGAGKTIRKGSPKSIL